MNLKSISTLLLIIISFGCDSEKKPDQVALKPIFEKGILPRDLDLIEIGSLDHFYDLDYDRLRIYRVAQPEQVKFKNFIFNYNKTGSWIENDSHIIFKSDSLSVQEGYYFKLEYSKDLGVLSVKELKL